MTEELTEPREGFAGIRWSESRDVLLARFKGTAIATRAIEGRHPRTGEIVRVGPGLVIDHHPRGLIGSTDVRVSTTVDFAGSPQIACFSVGVEPLTVLDKAQLDALAGEVLSALARRLRFAAPLLDQQQQAWTVDGARISLAMEQGPGDFMLTIARPG